MTNEELEKRLEELEKKVELSIQTMMQVEKDFMHSYNMMMKIFGLRFIKDKASETVSCQINSPTKKNPNPGVIADIYFKVQQLWKKNTESRIVMPH